MLVAGPRTTTRSFWLHSSRGGARARARGRGQARVRELQVRLQVQVMSRLTTSQFAWSPHSCPRSQSSQWLRTWPGMIGGPGGLLSDASCCSSGGKLRRRRRLRSDGLLSLGKLLQLRRRQEPVLRLPLLPLLLRQGLSHLALVHPKAGSALLPLPTQPPRQQW